MEGALWVAVLVLLSPLVLYAGKGWMPLALLFGIALGIALALALVGRRLHDALLHDVISGRGDKGKALLIFGMMLAAVFLVLAGAIVALILIVKGQTPAPPI